MSTAEKIPAALRSVPVDGVILSTVTDAPRIVNSTAPVCGGVTGTSLEVREQSRELTAAMIVVMEEQRRDLTDEIAFHRSQLRNDLAGENWKSAAYTVRFVPGFYAAVPIRRLGNAIAFKRVRREPWMTVRRKAAK